MDFTTQTGADIEKRTRLANALRATTPTSVSFSSPQTDLDIEKENIDRRRKYAQALREQGSKPAEGKMVGNIYVAPSWTQQLANAFKSFSGAAELADLDKRESDLTRERRTALATTLRNFNDAMVGKPEQTVPSLALQPNDDGSPQMVTNPAVPPDRNLAYEALMSNPDTMKYGLEARLKDVEKKPQWKVAERYNDQTGREEKVLYNESDPSQVQSFGGQRATKMEVGPAGQVYDPFSIQPGQVLADPNKPFNVSNGRAVPNSAYQAYELEKASRSAARNNNTVINAGPKAFETELGKLDAEKLGQLRTAAEGANSTLATIDNLRGALASGVFDGGGAQTKTAIANMLYGLTGVEMNQLPGSQRFNAEASKLILDRVKTLGANPSNADREFIERTVPNLATSAQARSDLIDYMERQARKQVGLYRDADAHARKNSGLGGFDFFPRPSSDGWSIEEVK